MKQIRPICPVCGKKLRNDRAMVSHIRDAHGRASAFEREPNPVWVFLLIWLPVIVSGVILASYFLAEAGEPRSLWLWRDVMGFQIEVGK